MHIGILLWLKPFRKEHRCCCWLVRCVYLLSKVATACLCAHNVRRECRWKIAPRVALLACTVWAEMVTISQLLSSSKAGPSQATVALSAILIVGILLLVALLPVAFFRAKLQDAREQVQFRKVFALIASIGRPHVTRTIQVEIAIAKNLALQQAEMSEIRPRVLPDEDSHTLIRIRAGTASPDDDESGAAQQASTRAHAIKVDAAIVASVLRARARVPWGSMRSLRSTRPHGAFNWRGPSRSPSGNSSASTSALPKRRSDGSHASTARRGH